MVRRRRPIDDFDRDLTNGQPADGREKATTGRL
jgi:hypothetical protein